MKLKDLNGAGFLLGDFFVPPNGEARKPDNLTEHQEVVLKGWIKSGIVGAIDEKPKGKKKDRD